MAGEASGWGRWETLAPNRVAEVIVARSDGSAGRGSGYRVRKGLVLTAAHVVTDAVDVTLRFDAAQPGEWSSPAMVAWCDAEADVALLRLARVDDVAVTAAGFGRLMATAGRVEAQIVGFPRWKLRTTVDGGYVREAHHAVGSIAGLSNPKSRTLEIKVDPPAADPDPSVSPWEAMSGAAVWVDGCVVGVVSAHHRREGLGFLTAVRIEPCLAESGEPRDLLGLGAEPLVDVLAVEQIPGRALVEPGFPGPVRSQLSHDAWRLPPRNDFFVGRRALLGRLEQVFGERPARGRAVGVVSLQGMGGIGKTQIADEYAHRRAGDYRIVWWVDADTPGLITTALLILAEELSISGRSPDATIRHLWQHLLARSDWLLIYDNVDDPGDLGILRPPTNGHWLLTSRNPRIARVAQMIEVTEFDREESVELLASRADNLTSDDSSRIAEALGDLPLAIEQAGYLIAESGMTATSFLAILDDRPLEAGFDEVTIDQHPGLIAVVAKGRERLESANPQAASLLRVLAALAPEPIPVGPGFGLKLGGDLETAIMIRELTRSGLVKRRHDALQMHRLVQVLLRSSVPPADLIQLYAEAASYLAASAPGDPQKPADWPNYAAILPHIQAVTAQLAWDPNSAFVSLVADSVFYLYRSGRWTEGVGVASEISRQMAGRIPEDSPAAFRILNTFGGCLSGLRRFDESIRLYEDVLPRLQETLGEHHYQTLGASNNLGVALAGAGQHERAERLLRSTLEGWQAIGYAGRLEEFRTADNLAEAILGMGDVSRAIALLEETLASRERNYPSDQQDRFDTLQKLGVAWAQVDRDKGRDVLVRTLDDQRRVIGVDHPDTLHTESLLAEIDGD